MRVNVYAEELTTDAEVVTKHVDDAEFGPRTFYGVRLYLESTDKLHHSEVDDDRSCVTFWIPWTRAQGHNVPFFESVFRALQLIVDDATAQAMVSNIEAARPVRTRDTTPRDLVSG